MATWSISPNDGTATLSSSGLFSASTNGGDNQRSWTVTYTDNSGNTASTVITQEVCVGTCTLSWSGGGIRPRKSYTAVTDTKVVSFNVTSKNGSSPSNITTFSATSISGSAGALSGNVTVNDYSVTQSGNVYTCMAAVNGLVQENYEIKFKVVNACGTELKDALSNTGVTVLINRCLEISQFSPNAFTNEPWNAHTINAVYSGSCNATISSVGMESGIFTITSSATTGGNASFTISLPQYLDGENRTDKLYVIDSLGRRTSLSITQKSKNGGTATEHEGYAIFSPSQFPCYPPTASERVELYSSFNTLATTAQYNDLVNGLDTTQTVEVEYKFVSKSDPTAVLAIYTDSFSYQTIKNMMSESCYKNRGCSLYNHTTEGYSIPGIEDTGQGLCYDLIITFSNLPVSMFNLSTLTVSSL
jgi:hypothetical protein